MRALLISSHFGTDIAFRIVIIFIGSGRRGETKVKTILLYIFIFFMYYWIYMFFSQILKLREIDQLFELFVHRY